MSFAAALEKFLNPTGWWTDLTPPKFYSYHPDTGEYLGEGDCDPSQPEEGVWIYPAHSVAVEPLAATPGYVCVLRHNKSTGNDFWAAVRDRRGEWVYEGGEFRAIKDIGASPELKLEVHDAQYVLPNNDTQIARIRMWVNDDVIEFDDLPELPARIVLAAWELQGETIRPIDVDIETVEERDAREAAEREEDERLAAERVASEQAKFDAAVAAAIEGRTEETTHG